MQFRERKSNNLRNLMRIGKRSPVAIQQQRREPPIDPSLVMNAFPAISAVENLLVPTFHTGSSSSSSSSTSQQQSARIFSKKIFHYYRPQSIWIK
jgi:hypothetical protein